MNNDLEKALDSNDPAKIIKACFGDASVPEDALTTMLQEFNDTIKRGAALCASIRQVIGGQHE